MSVLNSIIKLFVGDKQQKDLKSLQPIVEKVRSFENSLSNLSNDELRAKTIEFKAKIKDATKSFTDRIAELEDEAKNAHIDRQEEIYTEIDKLKDEAYEASEAVLFRRSSQVFEHLRRHRRVRGLLPVTGRRGLPLAHECRVPAPRRGPREDIRRRGSRSRYGEPQRPPFGWRHPGDTN